MSQIQPESTDGLELLKKPVSRRTLLEGFVATIGLGLAGCSKPEAAQPSSPVSPLDTPSSAPSPEVTIASDEVCGLSGEESRNKTLQEMYEAIRIPQSVLEDPEKAAKAAMHSLATIYNYGVDMETYQQFLETNTSSKTYIDVLVEKWIPLAERVYGTKLEKRGVDILTERAFRAFVSLRGKRDTLPGVEVSKVSYTKLSNFKRDPNEPRYTVTFNVLPVDRITNDAATQLITYENVSSTPDNPFLPQPSVISTYAVEDMKWNEKTGTVTFKSLKLRQ